jgi:hypothetical protein
LANESAQAIVGGILLLVAGAGILGLGSFFNNSITSLVGALLLVGGIVLFFSGISGFLDKLRI